MIIHFTQALSKKLHEPELPANDSPTLPEQRWYAHLFRADRAQYIITVNTQTLFAVIFHGAGITDESDYLKLFLPSLREQLEGAGLAERFYLRAKAMQAQDISAAKATDPAVITALNNIVKQCKRSLERDDRGPYELADKLNKMPHKTLDFRTPLEALDALL
jgi:hypothetical protein